MQQPSALVDSVRRVPGLVASEPADASSRLRPGYFAETLVIVSHVLHYRWRSRLYAYAPYAREILIWAEMFEQVLIAAPCAEQEPPGDSALLDCGNLQIVPQRELGGESWAAKLKLICSLPVMTWELCRAMAQGDAIQVRCPGNLGLLGAVLAPLFSEHRIAKFAGQWNASAGESGSVRLQRAILRSRWWNSPVTVYGQWPNEPAHIIPFFNSVLTRNQISVGRAVSENRTAEELRHVLFVGRLSRSKQVDVLLNALSHLRAEGIPVTATIAGTGPEFAHLRQLSAELGLEQCVEFTGGVSFPEVVRLFERSGILVLASETEGWPKAIVEGMAFGLIAIGSRVGLIPEILTKDRGFLVPPRDVEALARTLRRIVTAPEQYSDMRARAAAWAGQYSIETLRESLQQLITDHWGVQPRVRPANDHAVQAACKHD